MRTRETSRSGTNACLFGVPRLLLGTQSLHLQGRPAVFLNVEKDCGNGDLLQVMARLQKESSFRVLVMVALQIICFFDPAASEEGRVKLRSVYAWGDSLTDTGNSLLLLHTQPTSQTLTEAIEGHMPYGETFFGKPTGRFSDGRLLIDFLVEELGASGFLEPSLALQQQQLGSNATSQGSSDVLVNFAVAGATALRVEYLNTTYNITPYTPYSLDSQLQWFSNLSVSQDKEALSEALIFFGEIGGNDYNYAFGHRLALNDILELVPRVVTQMKDALQSMVKRGVRYIVVQGDYPMGCLPLYKKMYANATKDALGCVEEINLVINRHNSLLVELLDNFTIQYNNVSFIFFDSESAFMKVFKNPTRYGFTYREHPCYDMSNFFLGFTINMTQVELCTDPSSYMIWDGPHFTEAMNKVLLTLFYTEDYAKPYPNFLTSTTIPMH